MAVNNTRLFGIGTSGLVGSRITELLADSYEITSNSSQTGFDITDRESLDELLNDTEHFAVLHIAAKTDVDACEEDKEIDIKKINIKDIRRQEEAFSTGKTAWAVNVFGTKNVIEASKRSNKKIIYVSTDFVFGGEDAPTDGYAEVDRPSPINWYAQTKYTGEKVVMDSGLPYLILRIAYPFRKAFAQKKDFVRTVFGRLSSGQTVQAITDHIMTPTYIDDIASALKVLLETNAVGVFHAVGSEFISPYDAVVKIADSFHFDRTLIEKTTREEFFRGRAPRPFNLSVKNDKIESLGVRMRSFSEGLSEFKS